MEITLREAWYKGDEDAVNASLTMEDTGEEMVVYVKTPDDGMVAIELGELLTGLAILRLHYDYGYE